MLKFGDLDSLASMNVNARDASRGCGEVLGNAKGSLVEMIGDA